LFKPSLVSILSVINDSDICAKPWRSISGKLLSNKRFKLQLESEGWRYVSVKGKKGSYLERTTTDKSLGTLVDPEHETAPLAMRALAA
jgi:hypothetical protein